MCVQTQPSDCAQLTEEAVGSFKEIGYEPESAHAALLPLCCMWRCNRVFWCSCLQGWCGEGKSFPGSGRSWFLRLEMTGLLKWLEQFWKLCLKICSPPLHHVCRRHERCMASDTWAETCANCRLRWPHWAGCRSTGHEYSAWFCSGPWGRLCVQAHVLPGRLCCDESLGHRKRVWRS